MRGLSSAYTWATSIPCVIGAMPVIMCEMQWRMLQQEGPPEDFVIATGRQESVRRFIELAAAQLGWGGIMWQGEGVEEVGAVPTLERW